MIEPQVLKTLPRGLRLLLAVGSVVLLSVAAFACSGSKKAAEVAEPTTIMPTASPAATVSPTAAPEAVGGLPVRVWKVNAPQPLPPGVVVYVEKGCTQCDGPISAIERVSNIGNAGDTTLSVETLFTAPGASDRYIINFVLGIGGSDAIYATVCSRGYCGALAQVTPDAQTTLYISRDRGVTWEPSWTREGSWTPLYVTSEGRLFRYIAPGSGSPEYIDFFDKPVTFEPPRPGAIALNLGFFGYAWLLADLATVVDGRGEVIFAPPAGLEYNSRGVLPTGALDDRNPPGFAVVWRAVAATYQGLVRGGKLEAVFRSGSRTSVAIPGAWLNPTQAVGNMFIEPGDVPTGGGAEGLLGPKPVLIDFGSGEITPLLLFGPISGQAYVGRNRIRAWDTGSFVRVATGGECLNVREKPSVTARILACYKDNVLLSGAGKDTFRDGAGLTWGLYRGPNYVEGWAVIDYLVSR